MKSDIKSEISLLTYLCWFIFTLSLRLYCRKQLLSLEELRQGNLLQQLEVLLQREKAL